MFDFFHKKTPEKLFYATDMHAHLIPGVDDGAPDTGTSTYCLAGLNELGVTRQLLTPHVTQHTFENTRDTLAAPFAQLKVAIAEAGIPVDVMHSAEYRLDDFFKKNVLGPDDFMLLPNNHVLIENSFVVQILEFEEIVFELKSRGYQPILAHPERYFYYREKREKYKQLQQYEVELQVNILSFAGHYGKHEREIAWWMLENGLVDYIGTDMHRRSHMDELRRFATTRDFRRLIKLQKVKNDTAFI